MAGCCKQEKSHAVPTVAHRLDHADDSSPGAGGLSEPVFATEPESADATDALVAVEFALIAEFAVERTVAAVVALATLIAVQRAIAAVLDVGESVDEPQWCACGAGRRTNCR